MLRLVRVARGAAVALPDLWPRRPPASHAWAAANGGDTVTLCTICSQSTAGRDDDDTACCAPCVAANLAPAPVRPPGWLRREIAVPYRDRQAVIAWGQALAQAWQAEAGRRG